MSPRRRAAPWLLALSGASALAYETVWMRQLSRAFGITVYAIAGLVALYMAGLALGAALAARASGRRDWLRAYAWLELAAGASALAASAWLLRLPGIVASLSASAPLPAAARLALAAPALLPPTVLLGATLPVLARDGADGARLYGANTLGALGGLLAAAFVSIGAWGETATLGLAAGLNLLAALGALALSADAKRVDAPRVMKEGKTDAFSIALFAASGFCALGAEVLWSRQLIPLLGNSTYAFALILAVYLAGLGLGSCARVEAPRPWTAFAALLAALGAALIVSAAATKFIGARLDSADFLKSPLRSFADFPLLAAQAAVMVGPAALVLGLLFPVALRLSGGDPRALGRLYAWNTLGGIAGSLFCGFLGFASLGGHRTLLALGALALASAAAAALRERRREAWAAVAGFALLAAAAAAYAPSDPGAEILLPRLARLGLTDARVLFQDESPAATIVGTAMGDNRGLFINGIAVSGRTHVGEFVALLPLLAARESESALVICFGAGNTYRQASRMARVDAVELVGDVVKRMPEFYDDAPAYLSKPGNRIFIEDGRNYLLRSRDRYDAIAVDAVPPLYSAGAVNLYTREFMGLARRRLNPGGVLALWLPTDSFETDYWRILRSLSDAFPHAAVWARPEMGGFLALGSEDRLEWRRGELDRRLRARAKDALPWRDLDEGRLRRGFILSETDIRVAASRYEPLTDDRPGVEFPLARFWRGERFETEVDFLDRARGAGSP